jgi:hypothetical protein
MADRGYAFVSHWHADFAHVRRLVSFLRWTLARWRRVAVVADRCPTEDYYHWLTTQPVLRHGRRWAGVRKSHFRAVYSVL